MINLFVSEASRKVKRGRTKPDAGHVCHAEHEGQQNAVNG